MSSAQPRLRSILGVFALGFGLKKSFDYAFDYVAYPAVLLHLGYGWGGLAMTIVSVAINVLFINMYDRLRSDFLLLEQIKSLQSRVSSDADGSLLAKTIRGSRPIAFVVLSWIEDPAVVTLYFRKGYHRYDGMSGSDWATFAAATMTANLLWIGSVGAVLEACKLILS